MRSQNALELLTVWEQGLSQPLLQRALILLAVALPDSEPEELAGMSIGRRDRHLLRLREKLFGPQLVNTSVCPACSERIEWVNQVSDLLIPQDLYQASANRFTIDVDEYKLCVRLPNSLDIAAVIGNPDTESAQRQLLTRCVLNVERSGEDCSIERLPDCVIDALIQQIELLDPQAEILISLKCPACAHRWDALFDIAGLLWTELNDWAERMLQTVHQLASGYGWSERDILELSPVRRQLYLGMLGT
ncbi:hypothetical protein [Methylotuvimicrobium sp. KM1]|uniref:T4 family baseplate hub assembly chaperone n=1 Tax=Methylotuvimicrobium sp. KM1 TaxID=3377707 RepID=UPI00384A5D55